MIKISCILPAYNEQQRIGRVLDVITNHPLIDEVIAINDGSTDGTGKIIQNYNKIKLITHEINKGKSMSVYNGIMKAQGEHILLLDTDLTGLTVSDITELIMPVIEKKADISISLRGNTPRPWKWIGLDYISGERVFKKDLIEEHINLIPHLRGFGLEVFLNQYIIKNKKGIAVVYWPNVKSPIKYKTFLKYFKVNSIVYMTIEILHNVPIWKIYSQIAKMRKLRITKKLKISLVIPAYNEEKYIGECLHSAITNGQGRFHEIIVIDNASTDRTTEIAKSFEGVRVIREEKKGLTFARQRGYLEATGDILAYVDSDTRLPIDYYDRIIKEFSKDSTLACFSGPHEYYDISKTQQILVKIFWLTLAFPIYKLVGYMTIGVNFAIKKEVLDKMNGFDTSITFYGEDTNIARRAHKYGKVKFSTSFGMPTSGRRLSHYGILKTSFLYVTNFVSEVIFHKPNNMEYKDIR